MSVQTEITRIKNAATAIINSIKNKGVTVPDGTKIDGISQYIDAIVAAKLRSLVVNPTKERQVIYPDGGNNGFDLVSVNGDSYLVAENIKKDITIFGVKGSYEGSAGSSDPDVVPATCTLLFYMDNYSPVAVACTQMTSSGVVSAFYQKISKNTTVTVSNVVCGSTLLVEDTGGDGLWFSGSGEQCVQIGSLPNGKGVIYRTPATSGTYYFSFDRS